MSGGYYIHKIRLKDGQEITIDSHKDRNCSDRVFGIYEKVINRVLAPRKKRFGSREIMMPKKLIGYIKKQNTKPVTISFPMKHNPKTKIVRAAKFVRKSVQIEIPKDGVNFDRKQETFFSKILPNGTKKCTKSKSDKKESYNAYTSYSSSHHVDIKSIKLMQNKVGVVVSDHTHGIFNSYLNDYKFKRYVSVGVQYDGMSYYGTLYSKSGSSHYDVKWPVPSFDVIDVEVKNSKLTLEVKEEGVGKTYYLDVDLEANTEIE